MGQVVCERFTHNPTHDPLQASHKRREIHWLVSDATYSQYNLDMAMHEAETVFTVMRFKKMQLIKIKHLSALRKWDFL